MLHSCGHPRHVCSDPDREWFEQLDVCYPTRHREAAWAMFEALHKDRPWHNGDMTSWAEKQGDRHPYHYSHGVTVWAAETDHGRGGNFTTQVNPWAERAPSGVADHRGDPEQGEAEDQHGGGQSPSR